MKFKSLRVLLVVVMLFTMIGNLSVPISASNENEVILYDDLEVAPEERWSGTETFLKTNGDEGYTYDGNYNYFYFDKNNAGASDAGKKALTMTPVAITEGVEQTYKISFWYSASSTMGVFRVEVVGTGGAGISPYVKLPVTHTNENWKWKKHSILITIPASISAPRLNIYFRVSGKVTSGYIAFDNLLIESINSSFGGFYDNTGSTVSAEFGSCVNLGTEIDTIIPIPDNIQFRFYSTNNALKEVTVISALSSYDEVTGNKKTENITTGKVKYAEDSASNKSIGFTAHVEIGSFNEGVTYYLEAYVWESLYGLKPLHIKSVINTNPSPVKPPGGNSNILLPYGGKGNLLKNGSFEIMDSAGFPEDWMTVKGSWSGNEYVSVDKNIKYHGDTSVKITTTSGGDPWVCQIIDVEPNTQYQAVAWVRQEGISGKNPKTERYAIFKFEYYSGTPSAATSVPSDMVSFGLCPREQGKWEQVEQVFTTPPNAKKARIYCRLLQAKTGTIWFDKITVFQVKPTAKLLLETDSTFYYPTRNIGIATATLPVDFLGLANGKVDFKLKYGDNVLKEQVGTELTDNEAFFEYETSLLTEKKKEYIVEAVLRDAVGKAVETVTTDIYCYDRPEMVAENGDFIVNDKVFVPTIGYHLKEEDDYEAELERAKKAGVNLVQVGYAGQNVYLKDKSVLRNVLNAIERKGMMGLVCLYNGMRPSAHPDNIESTKAIVRDFINHPAVFGYATMDEPITQTANPIHYVKESYKIIREIDDIHPVVLLDASGNVYRQTSKLCDVFVTNPYPGGYDISTHVQTLSDLVREEVSKEGKPFYLVNQAFDYRGLAPTMNDMRLFWYQGLLAGARGNGYYAFDEAHFQNVLEKDLQVFASEEQDLSYDLFSYGNYPLFNSYEDNQYSYKSMVKDNDVYMVVINRNNTKKDVAISLLSNNKYVSIVNATVAALFGAEGINPRKSGNTLTLTLRGRQTALIKFSGANIDRSELAKSRFEDLEGYDWAEKQIDDLFNLGIANATGDHTYSPGAPITRADFAVFLMRTLDLHVPTKGSPTHLEENFSDVDPNAYYAKEIAIGRRLGVLKGDGGNFNPSAPITRQEVMEICIRAMRYDRRSISGFNILGNPSGYTTRAEAAVAMSNILSIEM